MTLPVFGGGPERMAETRPCAVGLSGNYPRALDGLARLLSLDMHVIDPAWIGMKLRKLLNYADCAECGNATVIHKDGCEFCTACGDVGQCG